MSELTFCTCTRESFSFRDVLVPSVVMPRGHSLLCVSVCEVNNNLMLLPVCGVTGRDSQGHEDAAGPLVRALWAVSPCAQQLCCCFIAQDSSRCFVVDCPDILLCSGKCFRPGSIIHCYGQTFSHLCKFRRSIVSSPQNRDSFPVWGSHIIIIKG